MNEDKKIKVMREIPAEWDEVIRLAGQIQFGEIVVKVQDKKIQLVEYTVKRKRDDTDEFEVFAI